MPTKIDLIAEKKISHLFNVQKRKILHYKKNVNFLCYNVFIFPKGIAGISGVLTANSLYLKQQNNETNTKSAEFQESHRTLSFFFCPANAFNSSKSWKPEPFFFGEGKFVDRDLFCFLSRVLFSY